MLTLHQTRISMDAPRLLARRRVRRAAAGEAIAKCLHSPHQPPTANCWILLHNPTDIYLTNIVSASGELLAFASESEWIDDYYIRIAIATTDDEHARQGAKIIVSRFVVEFLQPPIHT
jgi:hypothetical protein